MRVITCIGIMLLAMINMSAAPALKDKPLIPAGTWTVKYAPNQAIRVYEVSETGEVNFGELELKATLERTDAKNVLLNLKDGKIERWTLGNDGRLFVEHFNPAENYPTTVDQIGIGTRKVADK